MTLQYGLRSLTLLLMKWQTTTSGHNFTAQRQCSGALELVSYPAPDTIVPEWVGESLYFEAGYVVDGYVEENPDGVTWESVENG